MHKARAFFFVCAGIFLLALAYHLGARSAGAQVSTTIQGLAVGGPDSRTITFVRNGLFYQSPNGRAGPYVVPVPVPSGSPVVATGGQPGPYGIYGLVVLEDGSVYVYETGLSSEWQLQMNIIGAPTPAQSITFGQLKTKYAK
jgi:hypothetical protein